MRKIEAQMNRAIRDGRNWASANTQVVIGFQDSATVYLHGHHIATVTPDGEVVPNRETFRDWPTATTRSRLRALGVNASIKNFEACIDGVAL